MAVVGAHKIEELFKKAASLQIHKNKVKEISDIIDQKFHDLLLIGEANAKYNGRDVIWYSDLPLTKAFRESKSLKHSMKSWHWMMYWIISKHCHRFILSKWSLKIN